MNTVVRFPMLYTNKRRVQPSFCAIKYKENTTTAYVVAPNDAKATDHQKQRKKL